MYLIIAFIWFEIDNLFGTFVFGFFACLLWPLTLGVVMFIVPLLLVMRWGAKRRGDNF